MKQTLLSMLCVVVLALCVVGYGRFQVAAALNEYSENWEKSLGSCLDEEMADRDWYVTLCGEDGRSGLFSEDMERARKQAFDNRYPALFSREEVSAKLSIARAKVGIRHSCTSIQRMLEPSNCPFFKALLEEAELEFELAKPIWRE